MTFIRFQNLKRNVFIELNVIYFDFVEIIDDDSLVDWPVIEQLFSLLLENPDRFESLRSGSQLVSCK